jgi:ketosteroid isomerase-like protein
MTIRFVLPVLLLLVLGATALSQNTNSSATTPPRPRTTPPTNQTKPPQKTTDTEKPKTTTTAPKPVAKKPAIPPSESAGSEAVVAAFNNLLAGIRHADVGAVTSVYWNSPRLVLFNNNGTVTKSWEQVKKNRESSYPELKDVKLDVKDVAVTMLGRDGAVVTCLWTQSQTYKGTPETASGRMTLVFKRVGNAWKAIHLHTSPDAPNPASVLPSEQVPSPKPSPTPSL